MFDSITAGNITNFLLSDFRSASPILLAALGLSIGQNAGVVNIGAEGMMLAGCFAASLSAFFFQNIYIALLSAILAGCLFGCIFAFVNIVYHADEIVVGAGINILAAGVTITLGRLIFTLNTTPPQIVPIPRALVMFGTLLFVPVTMFFLYKTNAGLSLRAVGFNKIAARAAGLNTNKIQFSAIAVSGGLCGAGGALLAFGALNTFIEGMVAGRGFIAMAAVVFGRNHPLLILAASLIFGAGLSIEARVASSIAAVPYQVYLMLPYILTLLALCFSRSGKK
jgi:simple sugar transport system permease protein